MSERVTLQQVALKAHVSKATVCRALRSDPRVAEQTRTRIQAAADALGYRPDALLSAFAVLRRSGSIAGAEASTIAYITNFPTVDWWRRNTFYRGIFAGAEARARQLGFKLEHFWLRERGMNGKKLTRILYSRGISAVCIAPTPAVRGHLSLDWSKFSAVAIGQSLLRPAFHRATAHHYHGAMTALRELQKMRYSRIGFCLFDGTSKRVDDLWLAGTLIYAKRNPQISISTFLFDDRTLKNCGAWCRRLGIQVVISDDLVVLEALKKQKFQVPGDIDYVALAWSPEHPEIAGVNQGPHAVGAASIDLVVAQQHRGERGAPKIPVTAMVEGLWVPGGSVRKQPAG